MNSLERTNFDLKMKLHYLTKKLQQTQPPESPGPQSHLNQSTILHPTDNFNMSSFHILDEQPMEMLILREEYEQLKQQHQTLESQYLQLQLLRDHDQTEYQKLLQSTQSTMNMNSLQHEESYKREREVALAIAEHDAMLINKLQAEVQSLQSLLQIEKQSNQHLTNNITTLQQQNDELQQSKQSLQEQYTQLQQDYSQLKDQLSLFSLQNTSLLVPYSTTAANTYHPLQWYSLPLAMVSKRPSSSMAMAMLPSPLPRID